MRAPTLLVVTILLATGFAGCLQQASQLVAANLGVQEPGVPLDAEGFSAPLVDGLLYSTFTVTSAAGFPVHAEVYLPDPAGALPEAEVPERFPTVLLASPYNGAGYGEAIEFGYDPYDFLIERLLPRGYAVVVGDSSAMGGSGGCWDFMGPDDVASVLALVDGITQQPWSDGKVGMMGLSYDGMTQIMAASHAAPGLVTVVPAAPLTHAYAGLYMNGIHYGGGWMSTTTGYTQSGLAPPGTNAERYPGWADSVTSAPPCAAEATAYGNDPTGAYNEYYQARDFRPLAPQVGASVFYIQGFLDAAVKPDNFGDWFEAVPGDKKAWLGHWYHQYPTAMNAGRDDLYLTLHRWFDHYLKGVDNGIDQELHVDVQDSQGRWRTEAAWPPADAQPRAFFVTADGALADEAGAEGALTFGGATSQTKLLQPTGMGTLAVDSDPLAQPMHIAGRPVVNLTLASDRPGGQVIVNLWEVTGDEQRRISRGAYNLILDETLQNAAPLTPMQAKTVAFELYPTDHVLPAGSVLRMTLETTGDMWFNPDPWAATLTLSTGGDAAAALLLPIVERDDASIFLVSCGSALDAFVDGCHDEDLEDKGVENE